MKSIADTPKMFSVGYYILPITPSNSNTYYCTECAYNEDEARRMFKSHMPDNCRINTVNQIKAKHL